MGFPQSLVGGTRFAPLSKVAAKRFYKVAPVSLPLHSLVQGSVDVPRHVNDRSTAPSPPELRLGFVSLLTSSTPTFRDN